MSASARSIRRLKEKEFRKVNKIKRKAIQITLSDGQVVTVKAPSMEQFADFMNSFAVLKKIVEAFASVEEMGNSVVGNLNAVRLDKQTLEEFYPLLAMLSDITVDEFKELPWQDGVAIMLGYIQLLSPDKLANPIQAAAEALPQTEEQPSLAN